MDFPWQYVLLSDISCVVYPFVLVYSLKSKQSLLFLIKTKKTTCIGQFGTSRCDIHRQRNAPETSWRIDRKFKDHTAQKKQSKFRDELQPYSRASFACRRRPHASRIFVAFLRLHVRGNIRRRFEKMRPTNSSANAAQDNAMRMMDVIETWNFSTANWDPGLPSYFFQSTWERPFFFERHRFPRSQQRRGFRWCVLQRPLTFLQCLNQNKTNGILSLHQV